jgi:hypothetical protein
MTTSPESPQLAQSSDAAITAQLAEWALQDAALGLRRERDVVQALKEQAEMRLIQQSTEFHEAKERIVELEVFALDLQIRLTEQEEVVAALRAELDAHYAVPATLPAKAIAKVRAVLSRLRASATR